MDKKVKKSTGYWEDVESLKKSYHSAEIKGGCQELKKRESIFNCFIY
jgi:hypothetical protein